MVKQYKKKAHQPTALVSGERAFIARTRMYFDHGRVRPAVGEVVILSPEDMKNHNIDALIRNGALEPVDEAPQKDCCDG